MTPSTEGLSAEHHKKAKRPYGKPELTTQGKWQNVTLQTGSGIGFTCNPSKPETCQFF
ncbi:hypothetical protein [Deinococcus cellulosilyticus]|uniref:hypothetical protein n=1 Tax=Deinococcus cellulosilyticus TaxID=401558 RepID=UPI00164A0BEE|nr:hypothetical protein [Deinococcus cellulosilyticus]